MAEDLDARTSTPRANGGPGRPTAADPFSSTELFRYARVRPPRVIDLERRASRDETLRDVLARPPEEQREWAVQYLASDEPVGIDQLRFGYLRHLTIDALPTDRMPMAADLRDRERFDPDRIRHDAGYRADREHLLVRVVALRILDGADRGPELRAAVRLLDFVETFPDLARVRTREPYATVVLERAKLRTSRPPAAQGRTPAPPPASDDFRKVADGLHLLWRARNRYLQDIRRDYEQERREIVRAVPELPRPSQRATATGAGAADERAVARARAETHSVAIRKRTTDLAALKARHEKARRAASLEQMLDPGSADVLAKYAGGRSAQEIAATKAAIQDFGRKYDVPVLRFCEAYEKAVAKADTAAPAAADDSDLSGCYTSYPELVFADTVRILGEADLIRVDETFVGYSAGEISYVENVLAGEVRKRRVTRTRYAEQSIETITEETTDAAKETSGSTKQELRSQVESELATRLESDVSASANASGGGTIGVVQLQGGGSVDASVGVGVDQSLATSTESQFSQEIVSKALEKTRRSVAERRLTRSYSVDETVDHHAIHNDRDGATSFNGVYCFLDKHIAITESVYGRRLFLLANIHTPGRSLLCARLQRLQLALDDVGAKPLFDITPADITPKNYMLLAGRFKAQNVEPPPAPVITLGRTFKTDATNTNAESDEFSGRKIAEVLVPYFARYKRFLIAENVALPDGYEVMDVTVTVNHGANGISIPADLPIRAGGAMAFAAPALVAYGGYGPFLLPVWLWYLGFLASPLLHYNCDSSNVTIGIGTESQDSPYYFFEPDALIRELFTLLGSASTLMPSVLEEIEDGIVPLMTELAENAGQVPEATAEAVTSAVEEFVAALRAILDDIIAVRVPEALEKLANLGFTITQTQLQNLQDTMGTLFEPFRGFIQGAIDLVAGALGTAITDLFAYFAEVSDNSQTFSFTAAEGTRGELPVTFNTVAVKPGITITMSACLRRTDEALARWQLDTFATFYRAHLQLAADHESRAFLAGADAARRSAPSATLRAEEHAAVKERVLVALNNVQGSPGSTFTFDRMNLFEHALDWPNMSFRVFNHGPTADEIRLEKKGAFVGVDARRRAFSTALWAQVMIPVSAHPHFVEQVLRYFEDGEFSFEGSLQGEELVALYRDVVLGREAEPISVSEPRFEVVPTDFVALQTAGLEAELPRNPAFD